MGLKPVKFPLIQSIDIYHALNKGWLKHVETMVHSHFSSMPGDRCVGASASTDATPPAVSAQLRWGLSHQKYELSIFKHSKTLALPRFTRDSKAEHVFVGFLKSGGLTNSSRGYILGINWP